MYYISETLFIGNTYLYLVDVVVGRVCRRVTSSSGMKVGEEDTLTNF